MINPARNAPSASEAPAAAVPSAVSVPIKMTAIRNSSRLRVLRISASARGTIVRAAMMTPTTTSAAFPSASASPAMPPCDLPARKGSTSMIGTTHKSWKIRTPVASRPCGASISPLSVITLSTMAVLDSAIRNPRNSDTRQPPSNASPTASVARIVKPICEKPPTRIWRPISLSRLSENSMPIVNSRRITPTSASPSTSCGSDTSPSALGPSRIPATMKPGSAGSLSR